LLTLYHSCLHRLADRHTNLRPDPERNRFHPDLGLRRCACHCRRSYHHSGKSGEGWLGVDGQGLEGQEHDPDFVLLRSCEFMHSEHRRGFVGLQPIPTSRVADGQRHCFQLSTITGAQIADISSDIFAVAVEQDKGMYSRLYQLPHGHRPLKNRDRCLAKVLHDGVPILYGQ
jgi:hypothetical protein